MPFNRLTKLSVVIPMRNERDNAASLIHELLRPEQLMDFIGALENALGKTAELSMMPMQPGM